MIQYSSHTKVWYRLDKNWKRSDTLWQNGTSNFAFSDDRGEGEFRQSTMLHRGSRMVFLTWKGDTLPAVSSSADWNTSAVLGQIENCTWLEMGVIGNIRPDWFLDKRGDQTDVQCAAPAHHDPAQFVALP